MNALSAVPSKEVIANCFKEIISVASGLKWYNYKEYFTRKAHFDMVNLKQMPLSYYNERIEQMKRISLVQNLYSEQMKFDKQKYFESE